MFFLYAGFITKNTGTLSLPTSTGRSRLMYCLMYFTFHLPSSSRAASPGLSQLPNSVVLSGRYAYSLPNGSFSSTIPVTVLKLVDGS